MLTQKFLQDRFEYKDGNLFYKKTVGPLKKHKKAGHVNKLGYLRIVIKGKLYPGHHLIWMFHFGRLTKMIDHIDGNPSNNRIENLREANWFQQNSNRGKHKRNTSGFKGVTWVASCGRFSSRIAVGNKRLFLGYFDNPKEAHEVYCIAAKKYHANFARTD